MADPTPPVLVPPRETTSVLTPGDIDELKNRPNTAPPRAALADAVAKVAEFFDGAANPIVNPSSALDLLGRVYSFGEREAWALSFLPVIVSTLGAGVLATTLASPVALADLIRQCFVAADVAVAVRKGKA